MHEYIIWNITHGIESGGKCFATRQEAQQYLAEWVQIMRGNGCTYRVKARSTK